MELAFSTRTIGVGPMPLNTSGVVESGDAFRINPNPIQYGEAALDGATDYINVEVVRGAQINTPLNGYIYWVGSAVGDDEVVDYSSAGPFTEVP